MAAKLATLYHNLYMMLDAGLPVVRSLNTAASGLDRALRRELARLAGGVADGSSLSEMVARRPRLFEPLDVMLIQAAETAGTLPETFRILADWHAFRRRITNKIRSGLLLPILLIHVAAIFAPLPAQFLGGWNAGSYIRTVVSILSLFYVPAGIILCIVHFTPATGRLRAALDSLALKVPVLGQALYRIALSRYCWVFHMFAKAGLPATKSAENAAAVTGNAVVANRVKGGAASAREGSPISEGFSTRLPAEFLELWRAGEETGRLDETAKRLADNYAARAEFWFNQWAIWLPRVVYFIICGIIAVAILKALATLGSAYSF